LRESVVDGLIAAELESAVPARSTSDPACDHEKEINDLTESGQQIAARLASNRGRAIETNRSISRCDMCPAPLFAHIAIEFLIDYLELLSGE